MENLLSNSNVSDLMSAYVLPFGKNIVMAIIIYIVGRIVAKLVTKLAMKLIARSTQDEMLLNFIRSMVSSILLLLVIIASLSQLGVDTTSLIALIGAAGLAIGLSLQDSLKNFASGVMILVFKPFRKGDYVEVAGIEGAVSNIAIFSMSLHTPDNKEITIPNGAVLASSIVNFSSMPSRRVDLVIRVGYNDDIKKAKQVLTDILSKDERILAEPAPGVAIGELGDSAVNFNVRPWVKSEDYWAVYSSVLEEAKLELDKAGITIPYPQMEVNVKK